jgi:sister-chromatid-cohesion protein PDS5
MQKALEGTPMQAKYAARYIAHSKVAEAAGELLDVRSFFSIIDITQELTDQDVIKRFSDNDEDRLLPNLRVLAELALSAPSAFEERSSDLMDFVLNQVMFAESPTKDVSFSSSYL